MIREGNVQQQVVQILRESQASASKGLSQGVQEYALWHLEGITPVSKHSAVYHFGSEDSGRGSPIVRGRRGRTVWSRTWHTTMLANVGRESNREGPLPWLERDYTPISTAQEWENGKCDILIKIYNDV